MLNTNKPKDLAGCFPSLKCFVLLTIPYFEWCVFRNPHLENEGRVRKMLGTDSLPPPIPLFWVFLESLLDHSLCSDSHHGQ